MESWPENCPAWHDHRTDPVNQPSKLELKDQLALAAEEIIRLKSANERMAEELVLAAEVTQSLWTDNYTEPLASEAKYHSRVAAACILVGLLIGMLIAWVAF